MSWRQLSPAIQAYTNLQIKNLAIKDDKPIDSFQAGVQKRLLITSLYDSKILQVPFIASGNVGLFYKPTADPIVPDMFLTLGICTSADYSQKINRCYIVAHRGKVPDVCIEFVSNRQGDELIVSRRSRQQGKKLSKKDIYAEIGVPYFVVLDSLRQIRGRKNMNKARLRIWKLSQGSYTELTPPTGINREGNWVWLEEVGLGLTLWFGEYEGGKPSWWLRWCDLDGQIILTGTEVMQNIR